MEWALFWIFVHSCSIWLLSLFLTRLTGSGFVVNYLIYIFVMGLGITTIARIIRMKTRKKEFLVNTDFFVWVCVSAVSFWIIQNISRFLFNVTEGLSYFLLMGFGVYIISMLFSKISIPQKNAFLKKSRSKIFLKTTVKYGKNIKLENQVFLLVNKERGFQHIHSLTWNDSLYSDAQRRAREISTNFTHANVPDRCGENIGKIPFGRVLGLGFVDRRNIARSFMKMWMNSPGHRDNILRLSYSSMCIGIAKSGKYYYGVQLFS